MDKAINEANFTIGAVSIGTPSVTLIGTYPNYVLNFVLPSNKQKKISNHVKHRK